MDTKIAVLSNVNMNYVIRLLKKEYQVYEAEGYGNELGILLNRQSSYYDFAPEITFLLMDLMELLGHDLCWQESGDTGRGKAQTETGTGDTGSGIPRTYTESGTAEGGRPQTDAESGKAENRRPQTDTETGEGQGIHDMPGSMRDWLLQLESCIEPGRLYYVSDAWLWGPEIGALPRPWVRQRLEEQWLEGVLWLQRRHENVRLFPYRQVIGKLGEENSFSLKMWYLGKILHTNEAQKRLAREIAALTETEGRAAKKVLLVDLDNTLWGGLAGEREHTPLELSEDHQGLAYKNAQRVLRLIEQSGAVLGIVSKNNEEDALEVIRSHPHMVLREEDFAVWRINWEPKHENIRRIAQDLNLGLDSIVFWDDSPAERELVKQMLPQVEVPAFPERPEELAPALTEIYEKYFRKARLTEEDVQKTKQYAENEKRSLFRQQTGDFDRYLRGLNLRVQPMDPRAHMERLVQLFNKTNQFNLTTIRHTQEEMQKIVADSSKKVYLYRVEDRFGDYGIVSAAIVDMAGEEPVLAEWVLSCRVMGRQVEDALLGHMEDELQAAGYETLRSRYVPTAKNQPVAGLYERMGYRPIPRDISREIFWEEDGALQYRICLKERPVRGTHVTWMGNGAENRKQW